MGIHSQAKTKTTSRLLLVDEKIYFWFLYSKMAIRSHGQSLCRNFNTLVNLNYDTSATKVLRSSNDGKFKHKNNERDQSDQNFRYSPSNILWLTAILESSNSVTNTLKYVLSHRITSQFNIMLPTRKLKDILIPKNDLLRVFMFHIYQSAQIKEVKNVGRYSNSQFFKYEDTLDQHGYISKINSPLRRIPPTVHVNSKSARIQKVLATKNRCEIQSKKREVKTIMNQAAPKTRLYSVGCGFSKADNPKIEILKDHCITSDDNSRNFGEDA